MGLVYCLHAPVEGVVPGGLAVIMDGFFFDHGLCLAPIHWHESVVADGLVTGTHDVSVLHRVGQC